MFFGVFLSSCRIMPVFKLSQASNVAFQPCPLSRLFWCFVVFVFLTLCSSCLPTVSRMAACNAHNHELQRKVSQLEKCNVWVILNVVFFFFQQCFYDISSLWNIPISLVWFPIHFCQTNYVFHFFHAAFPSSLQVTNGTATQAAGSGHEYV